jgi:hypothetical protein
MVTCYHDGKYQSEEGYMERHYGANISVPRHVLEGNDDFLERLKLLLSRFSKRATNIALILDGSQVDGTPDEEKRTACDNAIDLLYDIGNVLSFVEESLETRQYFLDKIMSTAIDQVPSRKAA